jgi:catechol 2,3-dioxygenase-like lactoylglutathione lyase family enzyme
MSDDNTMLASTVQAMRPIVPAKDFDLSYQFYTTLGFRPERLTDDLVEMHLGAYSFILQGYYVQEWADNFVIHLRVSDVRVWWNRIVSLDLQSRFGIKARAPQLEEWGLVAGLIDPSGVLWRIVQSPIPTRGKVSPT